MEGRGTHCVGNSGLDSNIGCTNDICPTDLTMVNVHVIRCQATPGQVLAGLGGKVRDLIQEHKSLTSIEDIPGTFPGFEQHQPAQVPKWLTLGQI